MLKTEIKRRIEALTALPTLPAVVVHLLSLTQDEDSSAEHVARVIEADQALTARMLQLVNSPLYNFSTEITTVSRAVASIGYNAVRYMALGMGLAKVFPEGDENGPFRMSEFWKQSLACGVCAKMLARQRGQGVDENEAFVAGLLHNIGQALLFNCDASQYNRALEQSRETGVPLPQVEREYLGVDHTGAGKWLAEQWGLPDLFVQTIWLHHQPPGVLGGDDFRAREIYIVQLSDIVVSRLLIGATGNDQFNGMSDGLLHEAGVASEQVAEVQRGLLEQLKAHAPFIELECTEVGLYLESLQRANMELSRMGLKAERDNRVLARKERRFSALHQVNTELAANRSLHETLAVLAGAMQDGFEVPAGVCALGEPADNSVWGHMWKGNSKPREFRFYLEGDPGIDSIAATAPDEDLCDFLASALSGRDRDTRTRGIARRGDMLLLSMVADRRVVGHFVLDYRNAELTEDPEAGADEFLAFSAAAGMAVSRVHMHELLKRRSEELAGAMWKREQAHKQLLHSERLAAVGKMAAGAAHEVNNPLAIISGRAQMLLQESSDPAREKQLRLIVDQSARASKILNDLMRFARPALPKKETVRVNVMLSEVLDMFENQFRAHDVRLEKDFGQDLPKVLVDQKQIQQVLVNLLINAEHAIAPPGTVTVRTSANKAQSIVTIEVADTGCGIPLDQQGKVFEPFYTTKEEGKGTGLGLSLAHGIMASHQGSISLQSTVGEGTAFVISLPVAEDVKDPAEPHASQEKTPQQRAAARRVLVVDDEEQVRAIISEALAGAGYAVEHAQNGTEALEKAQANPPDLITLDIRMPRMDGMSVLRAIRKWDPKLPVIVITGLALDEEVSTAQKLGISAFIRKPFEVGRLLNEVDSALAPAK